ncbi:MAG: hypothetical protein EB092_07345 [Chitinophagia bacterium]|jgi:hypothetical protein|nr:hypothetical protein [Chitinophagia bacterium]NCA29780.1 hypothetical protein [Chitinophagia bacterium]NDD16804.1 hypothetical protein [Chitinophagia bacterium]
MFLLPLFVAGFGWLISWGFIKIIFFPHQSFFLAGRQRQSLFSKKVGQISISNILPQLMHEDSFQKLLPFIDSKLDEFFKEKLVQKMPIISMFIGDKTIAQLKEVFLEELEQIFPSLLSEFTQSTANSFLLNIETKWSKELESYLLKVTKKLRIAAFFLGFICGLLIQLILSSL